MENQILPDKSWMGKDLLETLNNLKKRKRLRDPASNLIGNMEKVMKLKMISIAEKT
jgi:hypothetical protein